MQPAPPHPAGFELRLQGHLDPSWTQWLGESGITHEPDGTTTLLIHVTDQAELHGVLAKVRDLGIPLIAMTPAAQEYDMTQHTSDRTPASATAAPAAAHPGSHDSEPVLSPTRLNLVRAGFLLMFVGLVLVKWPLLPRAHELPLYEGVTLCLLTAMSLLALLGLRHPARMLPLLVFETLWKVLWLGLVALPRTVTGNVDAATSQLIVNCSFVVFIIAVTPWRHVWRTFVRGQGERWR